MLRAVQFMSDIEGAPVLQQPIKHSTDLWDNSQMTFGGKRQKFKKKKREAKQ